MSPVLDSIGSVKGYGWGSFVDGPIFESIATGTPTTGVAVNFTSIPQNYKHLQIRYSVKTAASGADINLRFNNISTSTYGRTYMTSTGSFSPTTSTNYGNSGIYVVPTNSTWTSFGIIDIFDYASTSKAKSIMSFNGKDINTAGSGYTTISAGYLNNTAAITDINFTFISGTNWSTGTKVALYGVKY